MKFDGVKSSENLFNYTIPLMFYFPLFKESISSFLLMLLVVNCVLYIGFHKKFREKIGLDYLVYTIPFIIVFVFCFVFFNSFSSLYPISKTLFFLIFPLCYAFIPNHFFSKAKLNVYFSMFSSVCLFISIFYLVYFFYSYTIYDFFVVGHGVPKFRDFVYNEIPIFKIHPTYFSAMLFFCIGFSLKKIFFSREYLYIIHIILFLIMPFLLAVKVVVFSVFIMIIGFFIFAKNIALKKKWILILFFPLIYVLFKYAPGIQERFYESINSLNAPAKDLAFDSTNTRVAIFQCDLSLIKGNFWCGIGFENVENSVEDCLQNAHNINLPNNTAFMTHNYYFYIIISSGIIGLSAFLFYLFKVILFSFKLKEYLFYSFLALSLLICFTEDYFYRSYGSFYFNLMLFTFYKYHKYSSVE